VSALDAEGQKRIAGEAAAALVQNGQVVGLGTGSTAAWFVRALAARGLDIRGVPTSERTATLARELGIPLAGVDEVSSIDITVDGADEIGPELALIKGGGGALLREKLVWELSRRCVVIADTAKRVETLGAFALPVEVVSFGHKGTSRRICDALAECDIAMPPRLRKRDGQPFQTDNGNLIYDIDCGAIPEPTALAEALKAVTGVVDHGLFLGLADLALVGGADGRVSEIQP
jgi:ribose 5-phosphate isomerase A